jgi:hypothetical protein
MEHAGKCWLWFDGACVIKTNGINKGTGYLGVLHIVYQICTCK